MTAICQKVVMVKVQNIFVYDMNDAALYVVPLCSAHGGPAYGRKSSLQKRQGSLVSQVPLPCFPIPFFHHL